MTKGQNIPPTRENGPGNTAKSTKVAATKAAGLKNIKKVKASEGAAALKEPEASMTEESNNVEEDGALDTEEGEDERYYVARDVNTDDESAQAGPSKKAKTNDGNTRAAGTHSSATPTTEARAPRSATVAANTASATSSNIIRTPSGRGQAPPAKLPEFHPPS